MFDAKDYQSKINEAAEYIKSRVKIKPDIAITAGSGLTEISDLIEKKGRIELPFAEIPHHPRATVKGHKGSLVIGKFKNKNVVVINGRIHVYEGHDSERVVFLTRVLLACGCENFIFTNAAGGLNRYFKIGSFMVLSDHINFTFRNPLIGPHLEKWGDRFVDMCKPYDPKLRETALKIARENKLDANEGVYIACLGPSYETKKEVEMLKLMADAVGMSTIPEVLAVRQAGKKALGISIITNSLIKSAAEKVTHEEVLDTSKKVSAKLNLWLKEIIKTL